MWVRRCKRQTVNSEQPALSDPEPLSEVRKEKNIVTLSAAHTCLNSCTVFDYGSIQIIEPALRLTGVLSVRLE